MPGNFRSDLEPRQQVMPAVPVKAMPRPAMVKPMPAAPAQVTLPPGTPMPSAAPTAGGPMPGQVPSMGLAAPAAPRKMKKGGCVKKMAKGGSVSSASKRADGIAVKGKTRGKIV